MSSPITTRQLVIAWLPTFLWCLVIATESTPTFSGGHTFIWLLRLLTHLFPGITLSQVLFINQLLRKIGHFVGYATLSWFAFRGLTATLTWQRERALAHAGRPIAVRPRWHLRAAVLAVLVTFVVSGLDEFHQSLLPGRTGVFHDVLLDTMGGIFVQTLLLLYWSFCKSHPVKITSSQRELQHGPAK